MTSLKVRGRWLECMMNRVSDGDRSTSLSFLSCGALQSDEIIGILKVLFRYVGNGTRLALTRMDWLNTREAVILVPDPIALCARASLVTVVLQDTPPPVTDCAGDSRLNLCHKTTFHNFSLYLFKQFATG